MSKQFNRTELLLGTENMNKLANCTVAVFGVGGVGGYVVEALARSGVGHFVLIDNDTVAESNINRQIIATYDTLGMLKVDAFEKRIHSINPEATVEKHPTFYLPENSNEFDFSQYDYVVDAIDTITAKIDIILKAQSAHTPIISSMGAGNKLDPTQFEVTDIYKTSMCPLAKVMRKELKDRHVKKLKVVYSKEKPLVPMSELSNEPSKNSRKQTPGSTAFVPSVAGLIIAGEVIKDLTGKR